MLSSSGQSSTNPKEKADGIAIFLDIPTTNAVT
jgi:hypothetical protein